MIERFLQFLPTILIMAAIAAAANILIRIMIRRLLGEARDKFKSEFSAKGFFTANFSQNDIEIEFYNWLKKNKSWRFRFWLFLWTPLAYFWAPTAEELIFRAPLIIAFTAATLYAWIAILISAVAFALVHYFERNTKVEDYFPKKGKNEKPDDIEIAIVRFLKKKEKTSLVQRIAQVLCVFLLGIALGFYGITYQSLWLTAGLHFAWNLFMPSVVIILGIILVIIIGILKYIFSGFGKNKILR